MDIRDGLVWVNGYIAVQEPLLEAADDGNLSVRFPYTVPAESVFVLCDNSADAGDSRTYGAIPLDDCRGRVVFLMRRRDI